MACKLNELREALQAKAVDGKVEGIPLDIAVIRLTAAVTKMQVTKRLAKTEGKFEKAKEVYAASRTVKAIEKLEDKKPEIVLPSNKKEKPEFDKRPAFDPNKKTMTYAGIGSRQTPAHILKKMTEVSKYLEKQGYTLNTGITFRGKEEGADKAFSDGTKKKNLFSPEKHGSRVLEQKIAKELHPVPQNLTEGALKLMARNTNQVFGDTLDTPVDFVLFYAKETKGIRPEGGTGQAVEMARLKGIPTINMAVEGWEAKLREVLGMEVKETKVETVQQDRTEGELRLANGRITFKNGAVTKEVSSLDELIEIASNLDELVDKGGNKYDLAHMHSMFTLMKNAGIKFNKVRLDLGEAKMLPDSALGWYTTAKGNAAAHMQLRANRKFANVSPMQVLLHEYAHHITMEHLDKNEELRKEVEALMAHVLDKKSELAKEYAFTNAREFLAEIVAEPRLKEALKDVPPLKGKESVWNALRNIFKELLESLRVKDVKEINAYTEAMELVLRISDKEDSKVKFDPDSVQEEAVTDDPFGIGFYKEKYVQPTLVKGQTFAHVSNAKFDRFAVAGDILPDGWEFSTLGSHIGDKATVDEYTKQLSTKEPSYVYDVKVKENANVLEMKDPGDSNWTANNMYDQLVKKFGKVPFTKDSKAKEVLDFLRSKGYGAVGYENTEEGGISYMVLSPDKFEVKLRTPVATKGKAQLDAGIIEQAKKCNK